MCPGMRQGEADPEWGMIGFAVMLLVTQLFGDDGGSLGTLGRVHWGEGQEAHRNKKEQKSIEPDGVGWPEHR